MLDRIWIRLRRNKSTYKIFKSMILGHWSPENTRGSLNRIVTRGQNYVSEANLNNLSKKHGTARFQTGSSQQVKNLLYYQLSVREK
jgi:hypothetical protein